MSEIDKVPPAADFKPVSTKKRETSDGKEPPDSQLRSVLRTSTYLFLFGFLASQFLQQMGMLETSRNPNIYYYLYALMESPMMMISAILCIIFLFIIKWDIALPDLWRPDPESKTLRLFVKWGLPILVLVVTIAGTFVIMHNHPFSMDEYMADFQAKIFAHGEYIVEIPKELRPYANAIAPLFVTQYQRVDTVAWTSSYWPAYAMIRSLFFLIDAPWLTGPMFTAISIVLVALVARQIWPERTFSEAELIAAALLAVSPQVLLTGMTPYAMPGHLCLNLLWLWLFLKNKTWSLVLACLVGFIAINLHKPTLHTFFVFPLLFRLLLDRRWIVAFSFASFYAFTLYIAMFKIGPFVIPQVPGPDKAASATMLSQLYMPFDGSHFFSVLSLPLLFSWEALPVTVMGGLALYNWRRIPPVVRDLAVGIAIVYVAHFLVRGSQGHGWGHRYCHGALGSLVLLAVAGWPLLVEAAGRARAGTFLAVGLAVALCVQLPYRAWNAEQVIRPFALSQQLLDSQTDRFVVIDSRANWYGVDLVRNGPYFEPKQRIILRSNLLANDTDDPIAALDNLRRLGTVKIIRPEEFDKLGLHELSPEAKYNLR